MSRVNETEEEKKERLRIKREKYAAKKAVKKSC